MKLVQELRSTEGEKGMLDTTKLNGEYYMVKKAKGPVMIQVTNQNTKTRPIKNNAWALKMSGIQKRLQKVWMHKQLWERIQKQQQTSTKTDWQKRYRTIHKMCQSSNNFKAFARDFNAVRSKVSNFYCITLLKTTKLRTKSSQKITLYKYKIDTCSNGNLIPINMSKVLFANTTLQT